MTHTSDSDAPHDLQQFVDTDLATDDFRGDLKIAPKLTSDLSSSSSISDDEDEAEIPNVDVPEEGRSSMTSSLATGVVRYEYGVLFTNNLSGVQVAVSIILQMLLLLLVVVVVLVVAGDGCDAGGFFGGCGPGGGRGDGHGHGHGDGAGGGDGHCHGGVSTLR